MNKLFVASKNKGKVIEIKKYLEALSLEIFSLLDLHSIQDIRETGSTFEENAFIKAKALFDIVKVPVLADDSGLEVDLLNGAPGIYSARYAGENSTDPENCAKLLLELVNAPTEKRTARFKCLLVHYDGISKRTFEGVCKGSIAEEMKGGRGFGYDPLFIPEGYDKTFAELGASVKNQISHRGIALKSLQEFLEMERSVT